MINRRLLIHKFCNNSKLLLSSSWVIFIRALVLLFSPSANFSSFEYLWFSSTNFSIHSYLVNKSKNRKQLHYRKDLQSFNYALLFALIQQNTVTFFSYSIRKYNSMISEIRTKDNLWRKLLGEILKGFFVTAEI